MKIYIITGTPGCGKTTIAKRLSKKIKAKYISLNNLASSEEFIEGFDEERDTYITNTEKLTAHLHQVIKHTIEKKKIKTLIIEGHFADIVPNEYIDIVVILRCHPDILKQRLAERNYNQKKVRENIQAEILGNASNYIMKKNLKCPVYEIDTTKKTIPQMIETIQEILAGQEIKDEYKFGSIDWLEQLSEEGRLNEFFN
jgi:adenylate kinase